MDFVIEQLQPLDFAPALEQGTETHRLGGHLDQVFARNMEIGEVVLSDGYSDEVSDHKCLKVILKFQKSKSKSAIGNKLSPTS
jgi:hypothetical protein